jgi:hypothetical protein
MKCFNFAQQSYCGLLRRLPEGEIFVQIDIVVPLRTRRDGPYVRVTHVTFCGGNTPRLR